MAQIEPQVKDPLLCEIRRRGLCSAWGTVRRRGARLPSTRCAWFGSHDPGIGWQQKEAIVTFPRNEFLGNRLTKYAICRDRGAVLYQCVAEPWRFPPAA